MFSNNNHPQDGGSNSHRARLLGETALTHHCPTCGQLLPNDAEAARIHAKLDADEQARQRQREADRLAGHSEGIAAAQPQIAALNEKISTMGETMDATIKERVDRERLAVEARVSGDLTVAKGEIVKLTKKIAELNRAAEVGRTPQQLGTMTEVQTFNALKAAAAFSNDIITRVPPGKPGADITVGFRHNGKPAGTVIIEVKNETGWGWSWPAKLRQNKQDAGADFAVLVTAAFPSKLPPKPMVHEGVLLCPPENLVEFLEIIRGAGIKIHLAKAAGRNINAGEKMLDFCAGKGRDVLQSLGRRGQRQKELNQELLKDVNKHIRASDKLADGQANDVRDFTAAIDSIIDDDDAA